MRKIEKVKEITTCGRVYRRAHLERHKKCPICKPHRGCNRKWYFSNNWKDQNKKKKQWQ